MAKRVFDFFAAGAGLVVLSPLFLVLALWIRLDSKGPVFFRQERVGRFGRPIRIHKFRTMVADAPRLGPAITTGGDARITRAGRFLRQHKLDELPQLIDVVRGDMSLVGPRPEVPEYVKHYPDDAREIVLSVRPGITDTSSIEFKDENDILAQAEDPIKMYIESVLPRKVAYYVDYAKHRTFGGDLLLILKTLQALVKR